MSFPPYNASVLSQYGSIFRFIPPQVVGGLVRPATPLFSSANILSVWDTLANSDRYRRLYQSIFAIEYSILHIGEYPIPSIIDIVNSIRLAKGNVFAEWKNSDTAKLFEDHGYKNKKECGGYFF